MPVSTCIFIVVRVACIWSTKANKPLAPSRRDDLVSLSYTIVTLLRGSLPWKDAEREHLRGLKSAWNGSLLCTGYPSVFAEFVDYARCLGFSAKPDYARWKQKFRNLAPGLPTHPLYDFSDEQGPYVGIPGSDVAPEWVESPEQSLSEDGESLQPYCDDFFAMSTWPEPATVDETDLFGDEERTVQDNLDGITEVPSMKGQLKIGEVMYERSFLRKTPPY